MSTAVQRVVAALEKAGAKPRKSGGTWMALCPAHADRNPSLHLSTGHDGRALLHCHAGCDVASVVAVLDLSMRDLFTNVLESRSESFLFEWRRAVASMDGPPVATTRHILLTLSIYASKAGYCFPSIRTLATDTALSGRTVVDHLRVAELHGWIFRFQRKASRGWKRWEYFLCIPDIDVLKHVQQHAEPASGPDVLNVVKHHDGGVEPPSIVVLSQVQRNKSEESDIREEERDVEGRMEGNGGKNGATQRCWKCGGGLGGSDLDECWSCRKYERENAAA